MFRFSGCDGEVVSGFFSDLVAAAGKWWVEYFQMSFLVGGVSKYPCVCNLRWAFARPGHPDMKRSRTSRGLIKYRIS